jgi:hypothetical protein
MTETESAERIYIREAAELLNRRMATMRKWEQLGVLPDHLRPHRGNRGWRYWTPSQIQGIREWLRETDRRPGKGLPHYNPTEAQLDKAIESMRTPRSRRVNTSTTSQFPEALVKKPNKSRNKKPATRKRPGS